MKANMHMHSRYSDGSLWPEDIVKLAKQQKIELLTLTDHDTFGGTEEFLKACKTFDIKSFPAVEIDCVIPELQYKSEILAYFPLGFYENTQALLKTQQENRFTTMKLAIEKARVVFNTVSLSEDEIIKEKLQDRLNTDMVLLYSFNKVDVYKYLKEKKVIKDDIDYKTFKTAFYDTGLLTGPKNKKPTFQEIATTILKDKGKIVIPHIGHEFSDSLDTLRQDRKKLINMLEYFKSNKVEGIELYYYGSKKSEGINTYLKELASEMGYFFTYGSDCHGPGSGKYTIEKFSGDFSTF